MTYEKKKTPKSKDAESQFGNNLKPAQRREQALDMKHKKEKEKEVVKARLACNAASATRPADSLCEVPVTS
jgi:hypothetical protein